MASFLTLAGCLGLATPSFAQSPPDATLPGDETEAPEGESPDANSDGKAGKRVALEVLVGGAGGTLAAGAAGVGGSYLFAAAACNGRDLPGCLGGAVLGLMVGYSASHLLVTPALVDAAGGGHGSYWGSVAGSATGLSLAAGTLFYAASEHNHDLDNLVVAAIFILPVAGAVIGYEAFAPSRQEGATAHFGLMPIVSVETTGVAAFGVF